MNDLTQFCAPGATFSEKMISVNGHVQLWMVSFKAAQKTENPAILFVAGWISMMSGWKKVLKEMTKDFDVYYLETREKISSKISGKVNYGAEEIGQDIIDVVSNLGLTDRSYILFGSSLGATSILDCHRNLEQKPKCMVLIGPNAVFRVPKMGLAVIHLTWPRLYLMIRPVVKWYLRNFRLDVNSDYEQYAKYSNALDAADPWKLRRAAINLSKYQVWNLLAQIDTPTLIVGASKDVLHEPQNLLLMVDKMPNATYLDLDTNANTHSEELVIQLREYLKKLNAASS